MGSSVKVLDVLGHSVIWWFVVVLVSILFSSLSHATVTDMYCLDTIKQSLKDPNGYLGNWEFSNETEGSICRFTGVECWHPDENRVLNLHFSDFGLEGQFPRGIENCSSLTGLDLSSNNFSGHIPSDISHKLKFVTSLDLSSNRFSGQIPPDLANCSYLNVLKLDNNKLTGNIPLQLGQLGRIKTFSVSNNLLSGQVPVFRNASVTASDYAGNQGLCGSPLQPCTGVQKKSRSGVIAAAAAGGVTLTAIVVIVSLYYFSPRVLRMKKEDDPEGNKWAKIIKGTKGIKASFFIKYFVSKFADIETQWFFQFLFVYSVEENTIKSKLLILLSVLIK